MDLRHIPLDQLKVAKVNVRHDRKPPDVSDILPSVRARGILQPLLVRKNGEGFEIVAGRRRFFAAKAVAAERVEAEPVPCAVMAPGDDAAALEASLVENIIRLPMDEMDQYEAFAKLAKAGKSVTEIADTFGVTDIMVNRRLAISNLLPKIRRAYRTDEIDPESLRILTMATRRQQQDWLVLYEDGERFAPRGHSLRRWLFGGAQISTRVALFEPEVYDGEFVTDLFDEDSFFADTDQFWILQNKAIAALRDTHESTGWSRVEILEVGRQFREWEHECTTRDDGGAVYIAVTARGEVTCHEGWITRSEARKKEAVSKGEGATETKAQQPEITKAMQNYLDLHRHAAVRDALLTKPGTALRLTVAHMIAGSGLWSVKPEPQRADKKETAASVRDAAVQSKFASERNSILKLIGLPQDRCDVVRNTGDGYASAAIFARLLKLTDRQVMRVLTFAMAETLETATPLIELLGVHLAVDMGRSWQPDETFFNLLKNKAVINVMLGEVGSKPVAEGNVSATGKVQKALIRECLAGEGDRKKKDGWLPRYMSFPPRGYVSNDGLRMADDWKRVQPLAKT